MNTKLLFLISLLLFPQLFFVCGCTKSGPKLSIASGTVTLKGEPLADVRVQFMKKDSGALSFAETDDQGRFELRHTHGNLGAEPGTYRVTISRKGKPAPASSGEQGMLPDEPILMSDKSPIEVEVTEKGPNVFDIDIK